MTRQRMLGRLTARNETRSTWNILGTLNDGGLGHGQQPGDDRHHLGGHRSLFGDPLGEQRLVDTDLPGEPALRAPLFE